MAAFSPACASPACAIVIPTAPDNSFEDFLASADRAGRFIVEVDVFPKDAAPTTYPSLPACGAPACSLGTPVGTVAESVELSFSDHPVFMEPDDSLRPNYVPDARLAQRVDIDTAFSIVPTTANTGQVLVGDIEIFNDDGYLDSFIDEYAVDGRAVRVLFGPESGAYQQFRVVEETFGKDWKGDASEVRLSVQDLQFRLDQPFVVATYAGSGGIEGDPSLAGILKPRLIGHRYNFTPRRISAANNVYQINNGPIEGVIAARDGGAEFTDSGTDVTTFSALVSLSLNEGEYATALNLGLIRIAPAGGALESVFSVEARGDSQNGYSEGVGALLLKEYRDRAGFVDTELDSGSFTQLDGFTTGYWFSGDSEKTFRDVTQSLTRQTNGRIISDSRLRAARIVDPADFTFSADITENQIIRIEPEGVIYNPIIKTIVKYKPNDAVLTDAQILDSVSEPDLTELQREYAEVSKRSGTTALRHVGAQEQVTIETDLNNESSALALLDAVSGLWQTERMTFTVRVTREFMFLSVGSVVQITYPRFGFDSGRNALIVRKLNDYYEQQIELRVLI